MGREEDLKQTLFQAMIVYVRDKYPETIDKAYEYFWDEQKPDELFGGIALELGFINFEDWLVYDYKFNAEQTLIDIYLSSSENLADEEKTVLAKMKPSVLSCYEVISVSKDKRIRLKDLLLGDEISLRERTLTKGLGVGDIFATRVLELDGKPVMSGCAYPFPSEKKKRVLDRMQNEFGRYARNVKPGGGMRDFLKDYGDIFNLVWMSFLMGAPAEE